jgi:hypothetical protein
MHTNNNKKRKAIHWMVWFCLLALPAKGQLTDTLIIFDYFNHKNLLFKTGRSPLTVHFAAGDSVVLDASGPQGKWAGDAIMGDFTIPRGQCRVSGLRVIVPQNHSYCLRISGEENYRNKPFRLDTLLCTQQLTSRPYIFWNVLRQSLSNHLHFKPDLFILSNKEFGDTKFQKTKRARKFYAAIYYEYNAISGKLTTLRD